ncbi:T9SS type A sorting domain-containing protein [uncultured Winogradskyella sp.]|uniref:T9SS type A sorting domain-containing protein n=1 Tax=uncultured Winogradskyella sp. TaxID=395353 RepID=UPI002602A84A|nr:T9SS type A sorting domain-containing protein [uncultured Winogradskyella sp.]
MRQVYTLFILVFCLQFGFGQIGFEESVIIGQNSYQHGVAEVYPIDIDGDGDMDIVSASRNDDKIVWYENVDGLGTFSIPNIISTIANGAFSVYAVDIDGDGDIDVVSASEADDKIAWYENTDGLGTFGIQQIISSSINRPRSVYASDIDGDGDVDVVCATEADDKVAWFENMDGQGTFALEQVITTSIDSGWSVYTSDIDGDGDMDVLSASVWDNKIAWYENVNGNGEFGLQQIITTDANNARSVYATDIDGDGDIDVLSASRGDNKIAWYENIDGIGTFGAQQIITTLAGTAESVHAGDIDGDGDRDVISASVDGKIALYENIDGLGTFGDQQIISTYANSASSVYTTDIDGDGDLDILFSTDGFIIGWFENTNGLGSFGSLRLILTSAVRARSVYSGDLDGDGDMDVLSASEVDDKIAWYENIDGQGTFVTQKFITTYADSAKSVYASDIDGDGDIDVLSASFGDDKIAWYENIDGLGTYGEQLIISTNADRAQSVYSADIDGDGDIDVLSASEFDDKIAWYENVDGQGNFGTEQIISTLADGANDVKAFDLDGDGDMDVVSASENDDKIAWYENIDGQGTFSSEQIISNSASQADSVYSGDIDSDGDLDVISASRSDDKIAWYENIDGQGTFSSELIITSSANGASSVHLSDIDNDGDLDVVSAIEFEDKVAWYENIDGQGTFGVEQIISILADGAHSVFTVDLDGDGDMDVLSASQNDSKISSYKNLGVLGNEINGIIRIDVDSDDCNNTDIIASNILLETTDGNNSISTFSLSNGYYQLFPDEGNYTTSIVSELPNYYTSNPTSQISNFVGVGNTDTVDFCIEPAGVYNDLNISVYPSIDNPRPGFDTTYQLVYNNIGTTQLSGSVSFEFDDSKIQFLSASEAISSQTASTLNFDFTDLYPFETRTIDLEFNVFTPPITNIGDELVATATINPVSGDETEEDNVFTLEQTVVGSYDPNDITCLQGEEIFIEDADKYLNYLIRFQNTGTASAINVNVEHVLDPKLDWSTMKLESLSHSGRVEIENETDVSFIFNNINLPDSTNDEPNSHGFIAFKIKPKSNVVVGDIISGVADIYFDFNPAIVTNTVNTQIVEPLSVDEFNKQTVQLFPNPTKDNLEIKSNQVIDKITIVDINGRLLKSMTISDMDYSIDVSGLSKGVYFLGIQSRALKMTKKFIKN